MTDVRAGRISPDQALEQLLAASQAQVSPDLQPATQSALPTSIPALPYGPGPWPSSSASSMPLMPASAALPYAQGPWPPSSAGSVAPWPPLQAPWPQQPIQSQFVEPVHSLNPMLSMERPMPVNPYATLEQRHPAVQASPFALPPTQANPFASAAPLFPPVVPPALTTPSQYATPQAEPATRATSSIGTALQQLTSLLSAVRAPPV